jgi:hypothetical protein
MARPVLDLGLSASSRAWIWHAFISSALFAADPGRGEETPPEGQKGGEPDFPLLAEWVPEVLGKTQSRWAFEFGIGIIGANSLQDHLELNFDSAQGAGAGLTYNLTTSYRFHQFNWRAGKVRLQPEIELPFMFTLVDQDNGELIPDLNGGVMIRWRDFPWNRYLYTTFAIGGGLSYSFRVWDVDYARHPGEDRSHLKFWVPVQFTFALPRYPRHQVTAFIDHQSGGTIFDTGGVNVYGLGYRFLF